MASQTSRVLVIDSTMAGQAKPLHHGIYSIMYVPSWLRLREMFEWDNTLHVLKTLEVMKEYFVAADFEERPLRAQRCLFNIRTLKVYGYNRFGNPRYSEVARDTIRSRMEDLNAYLKENPVVAWDWIVSWSECRAMSEAFPKEYVRMYRRLRSLYGTKRQPKTELLYFMSIMETVARERRIDMEYK